MINERKVLILKKKKKKKNSDSFNQLIKQIKSEYPNREGEVCINYVRKDGHDYVFSFKTKDYFTEFFNRGLLHPIPQVNAAYFYAGLKLRWAYYSSFSFPKLTLSYNEKQSSNGYDPNNVPIREGYRWYSILLKEIPKNCREVVDKVVIQELSTNGNNTRQKTKLMEKLRDGLDSIYVFLKTPRKAKIYS